ncbi:MAG: nitroreductase [Lachnospiraceae bacterium]|uniref:Nitroreductase n=1 Tax=Candidatus Weimeria bifida TaxID=2599074 RepID=A0A6N7IZX0_9FIRM|nr:nitroreductase [Candidatus Weimeria bifida]RRF97210.1 MAG: nitroreductase [Lachnospiraceae bacterium]
MEFSHEEIKRLRNAIQTRHAVRRFTDQPLVDDAVEELKEAVEAANREGVLHIQLMLNEPEAFQAQKPEYGNFQGCRNYLAMIGPRGSDEKIGYYGEWIVLLAQSLGVNSCWVAATYDRSKTKGKVGPGEKRYMLIALGYGKTEGTAHKSKSIEDVSDYKEDDPDWYRAGIEAALLAPTCIDQQKFTFKRDGDKVIAKSGFGLFTSLDLGIVKCNFEIGSGRDHSVWE